VPESQRSVLHVLPHPGGGGETYVDSLAHMEGYVHERLYLAPSPQVATALPALLRSVPKAQLAARRHDLLHVHGEVAAGLVLPALATRPSVVTLHGLHLLRRSGEIPDAFARTNLRLVVRAARRTICVSHAEYADIARIVGSRAAGRVVVIHNGLEPAAPIGPEERLKARHEIGIPPAATVCAFVGSLHEHKDPLAAVRAAIQTARTVAPLTLLVAGDGPMRGEVERAAREAPDAIRLLGFRADTRRVLAASDFYVLPSRREGLSYALLEAMSVGLAPIVSDAPGNPEAVGDAGVVVDRGDIGALGSAFARLATDEAGRIGLGERARERVLTHYRLDEMLRRTREVYEQVASKRPPAASAAGSMAAAAGTSELGRGR
jgi:glycosyltransferase involved in cell wall biosynthesis